MYSINLRNKTIFVQLALVVASFVLAAIGECVYIPCLKCR